MSLLKYLPIIVFSSLVFSSVGDAMVKDHNPLGYVGINAVYVFTFLNTVDIPRYAMDSAAGW